MVFWQAFRSSLHSLMKQSHALKTVVQTLGKNLAISPSAVFPLPILKWSPFSVVETKGFMVLLMDEIIFCKWWQFCFTRCNLSSSEIFSLLVIPSSSYNFHKIPLQIEWFCAERCPADIELVNNKRHYVDRQHLILWSAPKRDQSGPLKMVLMFVWVKSYHS